MGILDSRVWHGCVFHIKNGTFLYQEPVSRAEKSRLVFCFILLSLPGNLKSFLHESQKILSLFTELFTSPANAPVNKFLAFSRKCIFHGGISRITAGKIRTTDITQLSGPKKTFHDIITVCYDYGLCLHCGMTVFLYKVPVIIWGKFIGKSLDQPELGHIKISLICCICFPFPGINIYLGFRQQLKFQVISGKKILECCQLILHPISSCLPFTRFMISWVSAA